MDSGVGPALSCSGQLRVMAVSLVLARSLWRKDLSRGADLGWNSSGVTIQCGRGASEAKKVPCRGD